jgi:hypothetical protein
MDAVLSLSETRFTLIATGILEGEDEFDRNPNAPVFQLHDAEAGFFERSRDEDGPAVHEVGEVLVRRSGLPKP